MADKRQAEELLRRLAATVRAQALYSPGHALVGRSIDALTELATSILGAQPSVVVGLVGDDFVADGVPLGSGASLVGLARLLRDRGIEKVTFSRGVTRSELASLATELGARGDTDALTDRLAARGVARVAIGRLNVEEDEPVSTGVAAARRVYTEAVQTAQSLWETAQSGEQPNPDAARKIIDSLAKLIQQDRTSLMALTALKRYDNYTFTHMVNVSVLSMAQARSLNIEGAMLREFGLAALMHDIGKVHTPLEVLNKPDRLTAEEFGIMKRHVVDGAHILRRTPGMPALAPVVAFEHHLKKDFSGYPDNVGARSLNVCTMVVTIADVFDALRSNRVYREGLPSERIRSIMLQQESPAFDATLLRRFVNLVGLYPIGTLVRLETEEVGVVMAEHPTDPFRPQVKLLLDRQGNALEHQHLINTWERDAVAIVEAVDPDTVSLDPLTYL
ncbi:MAG: HD-GYP domain-containing protein [Acidobacteriota bacterium]|nr:HD-GYP domain-containing protein [Acidobacteriota bacterium]